MDPTVWPQDLANSTITRLEQRIAALEATNDTLSNRLIAQSQALSVAEVELAQAREFLAANQTTIETMAAHINRQWTPVAENWLYDEDEHLYAQVEDDGATIIVWADDLEEPFTVPLHLPPNLRLCRRPQPAANGAAA